MSTIKLKIIGTENIIECEIVEIKGTLTINDSLMVRGDLQVLDNNTENPNATVTISQDGTISTPKATISGIDGNITTDGSITCDEINTN